MTRPAPRIDPVPVRTLMVAATPYFADRGCHVRIQGETRALEKKGAEVVIATYGLGRDVPGGRIERAWGLPGYRRLDAAPSAGKLILDLLLLVRTLGLARRWRPGVIHAHTQEGGALGLIVGRLLGIPVLVDLQSRRVAEELDSYGVSADGGLLHRIANRFDHAIPRRADAVVGSTAAIADFVRENACPRGPVEVLADAVDVPESASVPDERLARSLGVDLSQPRIVYLGLLSESQGVDLLLAGHAALLAQRPGTQLLLMGYPDEERWRQQARSLGSAHRVIVTGRIPFEEAPGYLALGTLAISAKRTATEGNGKLLLYMSCGLPTIALDSPTNRQILGPDGLYFDDSPDALRAALHAALDRPEDLGRRGQALRERARHEASWDARADTLLRLYDVLRGGRAS